MGWKSVLSFIFFLIVVALLVLYWFVPFNTVDFGAKVAHSNFNLESSDLTDMQFYPNMRFADSRISYRIYDCTLQKTEDMKRAFKIVSDKTVLDFYPVNFDEEISVHCDSQNKIEEGLFIAGEGGPVNITKTDSFNVISKGRILLIKDFKCNIPNVAIHELLHVLGFDHSANQKNIMYNVSKCGQSIGDDIPYLINYLYSFSSSPDISFGKVTAVMHGKYLNVEIEVKNNGLAESDQTQIKIYADDKIVKSIDLEPLGIGYGKKIMLTNIWITKVSVDKLKFVIDPKSEELDTSNNLVVLELKK